jgi:hypothetical protein
MFIDAYYEVVLTCYYRTVDHIADNHATLFITEAGLTWLQGSDSSLDDPTA